MSWETFEAGDGMKRYRPCTVDGCGKPAKRVGRYFDRFCSMHRARVTRHGDPHTVAPKGAPFMHSNGYMLQHRPEHPLAMKSGMVYVHRAVLYDHMGVGPHRCHWCSGDVVWGDRGLSELVPDHLDDTKTNNTVQNLVASCRPCNTSRSAKGRVPHNKKACA